MVEKANSREELKRKTLGKEKKKTLHVWKRERMKSLGRVKRKERGRLKLSLQVWCFEKRKGCLI